MHSDMPTSAAAITHWPWIFFIRPPRRVALCAPGLARRSSHRPPLEPVDVREHFGDGLVEVARDRPAFLDRLVQRARERRPAEDRHAVLAGGLAGLGGRP